MIKILVYKNLRKFIQTINKGLKRVFYLKRIKLIDK
jgi:hypothetical protein